MAGCRRSYSVADVVAQFEGHFDIPDEGATSDIEGFESEDSETEEIDLMPDSNEFYGDISEEDNDDSQITDVQNTHLSNFGRPRNTSTGQFQWSRQPSQIKVPGFTKAVGQANCLPRNSCAVDFFWPP